MRERWFPGESARPVTPSLPRGLCAFSLLPLQRDGKETARGPARRAQHFSVEKRSDPALCVQHCAHILAPPNVARFFPPLFTPRPLFTSSGQSAASSTCKFADARLGRPDSLHPRVPPHSIHACLHLLAALKTDLTHPRAMCTALAPAHS